MFILLSYLLGKDTPIFGKNPPNVFEKIESIDKGDNCNSTLMTIFNHTGTHIDGPYHFDRKGKKIADYNIEDFIFTRPRLIEVPKGEDEAIGIQDMELNESAIQSCDLLFIKTGFHRRRKEKSYVDNNPWIDNEAAAFLREHNNLKAIGIDVISISSHTHLKIGEETHRILLSRDFHTSEPKLIIEDMNLGFELKAMNQVFVIPLFIKEADSSPCTIFAEIEDE